MKQPEDRLVFDQAFHIFWRNPRLMEKMRDLLLPSLTRETETDADEEPTSRRVDEACKKIGYYPEFRRAGHDKESACTLAYS